MFKYATIFGLILCWSSAALGQVIVTSRPVVTTYYAPATIAPVTSYYAPSVSVAAPVVTYRAPMTVAPVTSYYAPVTSYYAAAPVTTTYYGAAPVTSYYAAAPVTTAYYGAAPVTTYYGGATVVTTAIVGRPALLGTSAYGTPQAYVPGQPVRNTLRFLTP